MRSLKVLLAAAAAVVVCGCGGGRQPSLYKISVDPSPLSALPASCYRENLIPDDRTTTNNLSVEYNWYVWDGVDGTQMLDLNGSAFPQLGDADPIQNISNFLISGTDDAFTGTRTQQLMPQDDNYSFTETQAITVKFDALGDTARGTVTLMSKYSCTNCRNGQNDGKIPECSSSLNFTGRRIEMDPKADYQAP